MNRIFVAAVSTAALASCGKSVPSIDKSIETYGPAIESRLAGLEGMKLPAPTGSIKNDGPKLALIVPASREDGNATMMFAEDLKDLTVIPDQPHRVAAPGTGLLNDCAAILKKRALATELGSAGPHVGLEPRHAAWYLPLCAKVQYLIVIKMTDQGAAVVQTSGKTFEGSTAGGQALVFRLPGPTFLGGVPFSAKSSSQVTVYGSQSKQDRVSADLANQVMDAARDAVKDAMPGATFL